jgi:hypothetical protein
MMAALCLLSQGAGAAPRLLPGSQAMPPPVPDALSYDGTDVLPRSAMTPVEGRTKSGLGGVLSVAQERWSRRLRDQNREFWDDEVKRTGRRARRLARDSDPGELVILDELQRQAVALQQLGRLAEAEMQCRQVAEALTEVACLGEATVRSVRITHAGILAAFGRLPEAERMCLEIIGAMTPATDTDMRLALRARLAYADTLRELGKLAEATALYQVVVRGMTDTYGPQDRLTLVARTGRALTA